MNLFVCMLSFHYVTICLSYFLLSHSIYLSVYFSPSPLFSQLTPHPFDPSSFNDSTPPSPLKSVRKARASLCFFFVVQSVGLLDTSVGKIVTCERINRHYLHSCRFFRQLFRRFATNGPGLGHAESVGSWDPGSRQIEPSAEWEKIHEKKKKKK